MKRCFEPTDCYDAWLPPKQSRPESDHEPAQAPPPAAVLPTVEDRARTPSPTLNEDARAFLELMNAGDTKQRARASSPMLRSIRNPGLLREYGGLRTFK